MPEVLERRQTVVGAFPPTRIEHPPLAELIDIDRANDLGPKKMTPKWWYEAMRSGHADGQGRHWRLRWVHAYGRRHTHVTWIHEYFQARAGNVIGDEQSSEVTPAKRDHQRETAGVHQTLRSLGYGK